MKKKGSLAAIAHLREALQDLVDAFPCEELAKARLQGFPCDCHCEVCQATHALATTSGYDEEEE